MELHTLGEGECGVRAAVVVQFIPKGDRIFFALFSGAGHESRVPKVKKHDICFSAVMMPLSRASVMAYPAPE